MITIRRAQDRMHTRLGWLDSWHTFSFGEHYEPRHMGFRSLRVINDDTVAAGGGFGTHGHRDMEIISYVLEGALAHEDSLGNGSMIRPGDVQRMSAGSGVRHSEHNARDDGPTRFLQIWILPAKNGAPPSYEQKSFALTERQNVLRKVAAADGGDGAIAVHQDVSLYVTLLDRQRRVTHELAPSRHAWVQVAKGSVELNGQLLVEGDGAAVSNETSLALEGASNEPAEVLLFDLA